MNSTSELYPNKKLGDLVIGIIGGTGAQGTGLGYRLAQAGFKVILGSRDSSKAVSAAEEIGLNVSGASNVECAEGADVIIIAVPWESHFDTVSTLASDLENKVVIDCVNPLGFDAGGAYPLDVEEGSACLQAQTILVNSFVVTAFNHVSAVVLADRAIEKVDIDILVVGDNKPSTDLVQNIIDQIPGMRGIYAGKARNAGQVEALTANLISANRRYKTHTGIRITGINA